MDDATVAALRAASKCGDDAGIGRRVDAAVSARLAKLAEGAA